MASIEENLKNVLSRIQKAEEKSPYGQKVTLVAVSKTKPVSDIIEAYSLGVRDFGENKVQELTEKYEQLPKDIRWHMIGHLQTNKVKYIVGKVYLIHSVDSLHLARVIDKESAKKNVVSDILIQVNISEEETKFGVTSDETVELINEISKLENLRIRGLMTIAPFTENPESNRDFFKALRNLSIDIKALNNDNNTVCEFSMGMTGDFEVAVEEGATYVRVGTGVFGERNHNI